MPLLPISGSGLVPERSDVSKRRRGARNGAVGRIPPPSRTESTSFYPTLILFTLCRWSLLFAPQASLSLNTIFQLESVFLFLSFLKYSFHVQSIWLKLSRDISFEFDPILKLTLLFDSIPFAYSVRSIESGWLLVHGDSFWFWIGNRQRLNVVIREVGSRKCKGQSSSFSIVIVKGSMSRILRHHIV